MASRSECAPPRAKFCAAPQNPARRIPTRLRPRRRRAAEFLDEVLLDHAREFPDLPLVWRSQLHAGCGPAPLLAMPDKQYWAKYAEEHEGYNYARFADLDRVARARLTGLNRWYLDFAAMALRPDWRVGSAPGSRFPRDCMHFCAAGPLEDLVPRLFLQLLRDMQANATAAIPA